MKKILLFGILFGLVSVANAQKRNMFPAYSFDIVGENIFGSGDDEGEKGGKKGSGPLFVNADNLLNLGIDNTGVINGNTMRVEIPEKNENNVLKYYVEVFEGDELEIRFKMKSGSEADFSFGVSLLSGTGSDLLFPETRKVGTDVSELVFRTSVSEGHAIQSLDFSFRTVEAGTVFYIDELSIIKLNADWDGNLVRNGSFEIESLDYCWLDYNQNNDHHIAVFDKENALGSGTALKFTYLRSGADWHGNLKSFYVGDGVQYKVAYDTKNTNLPGTGNYKVGIGRTWDISADCFPIGQWKGDGFAWQNNQSVERSHVEFVFDEAQDRAGYNNHFMLFFGWYEPMGDVWFDNFVVEQIGLNSIEIVEWERTNSTVQLWINATPSSAQNKVTWMVDENVSTGKATIDEEGLLTVLQAGVIKVKAVSTHKVGVETEKEIDCTEMTPGTSTFLPMTSSKIVKTEYYTLAGVPISESQLVLSKGIYLVKKIYSNGSCLVNKLYLDK